MFRGKRTCYDSTVVELKSSELSTVPKV